MLESRVVVGIDSNPLGPLGSGVYGVKTDRDLAIEVLDDGVESKPLLPLGSVVVVFPAGVWFMGLDRIGGAVHEQAKIPPSHVEGRQTSFGHRITLPVLLLLQQVQNSVKSAQKWPRNGDSGIPWCLSERI